MTGDAPTLGAGNLAAAQRLLDEAKALGFRFQRIATGPDAPLLGRRETLGHVDEVYIAGLGGDCTGIRRQRSSLIVPGGLPVVDTVSGDALKVLLRVTEWEAY
jgi:hypothetical protein